MSSVDSGGASPALIYTSAVLLAAGWVYDLIGFIGIWVYRNSTFVRNRGIQSTIIFCGAMAMSSTLSFLSILLNLPCYVVILGIDGFTTAIGTFIFVRLFEIYAMFIANRAAVSRSKSVFMSFDFVTRMARNHSKSNVDEEDEENAEEQKHVAAPETVQEAASTITTSKRRTFAQIVIENRRYIHMGFFSVTKLFGVLIWLILSGVIVFYVGISHPTAFKQPFFSNECMAAQRDSWVIFFAFTCAVNLTSHFVIRKLKHLQENFKIISELKGIVIAGILFMIQLCFWLPTSTTVAERAWLYIPLWIVGKLLISNSCQRIAWIAHSLEDRFPHGTGNSGGNTSSHHHAVHTTGTTVVTEKGVGKFSRDQFRAILRDDARYHQFELFLCKEFSVENGCFWRAAEKFKELLEKDENSGKLSITQIKMRLRKVYDEFCSEDSTMPINAAGRLIEEVKRLIDSDSNFDPAEFKTESVEAVSNIQNEIFELMYKDSLRRYLKTIDSIASLA